MVFILDDYTILETFPEDVEISELVLASESPNWHRRVAAGLHVKTPKEVFSRLVKDERLEVREAVAGNFACPLEYLQILMSDEAVEVQSALGSNIALTQDMFDELIQKNWENAPVLEKVVSHPLMTTERIYEIYEHALENDWISVLSAIALSPYCPSILFRSLADHFAEEVRCAVALNDHIPQYVYDHLLNDESPLVRKSLLLFRHIVSIDSTS